MSWQDAEMAKKVAKKKAVPPTSVSEAGARFRAARKLLGCSQAALAERGGCPQPSISRFETGERGLEAKLLVPLLRAGHIAGINIGFVLTGEGPELRSLVLTDEADPEVVREAIEFARRVRLRGSETDTVRKRAAADSDAE